MASTELDIVISAQIQHQERIAKLINDVGRLQAQMNALNASGARAGAGAQKFNNALDAQSKAARNARQGMQQAGMQINDFVTSVSTGASPVQAFNQQIGQLGYAMSMMGGAVARVGSFLAGPWSVLVIGASMALGPLIEKFISTRSAAKDATDAVYDFNDAVRSMQSAPMATLSAAVLNMEGARARLQQARALPRFTGGGSEEYKANTAREQIRRKAIETATLELNTAASQVRILTHLQNTQLKLADSSNRAERATRSQGSATASTNKSLQDQSKIIEKEQNAFNRLREKLDGIVTVQTAVDTATGRATKALQDYKDLIAEIGAMTVGGQAVGAEYLATRAADLQIVERKLREATTDDSNAESFIARQKEIGEMLDKQKEQWKSVAMAVSDAFKGMITGAMGWKDALRSIINAVIDKLWEMYVVQQIVGFVTKLISPGTGSKDVGGTLGADFDKVFGVKPYATGGYPQAGKATLVGERGPELFIPSSSGKIVANHNLGGAGGLTINVDARGASDPAAVRAQVQQGILEAAPHIVAAAEQRTINKMRRPRLGGAMQ